MTKKEQFLEFCNNSIEVGKLEKKYKHAKEVTSKLNAVLDNVDDPEIEESLATLINEISEYSLLLERDYHKLNIKIVDYQIASLNDKE